MPGSGANPLSSAMLKMFGNQTNFSATTEMKVSDAAQGLEGTSKIAVLDGKIRTDIDMSKMKSAAFPPEVLGQMKQMGADQNIVIVRPDKSVTYMIYPKLNAYIEMPLSEEDKAALTKEVKIATTALGKETIDGHPCVKNKVAVTDDKGKTQEMTVWNATDLKNFPVQMEMEEKDSTILTKFKNIQFAKPDAKQFEISAEWKKYDGMQGLQQMMMQKMMVNPPK